MIALSPPELLDLIGGWNWSDIGPDEKPVGVAFLILICRDPARLHAVVPGPTAGRSVVLSVDHKATRLERLLHLPLRLIGGIVVMLERQVTELRQKCAVVDRRNERGEACVGDTRAESIGAESICQRKQV